MVNRCGYQIESFDIFDTVITRIVPDPQDIFWLIEKKYQLNGYLHARINSEKLLRLNKEPKLNDIYEVIKHSNKNFYSIKEVEVEYEYRLTSPIVKNINKVKGDSIFISDMYLDKNIIQKLLTINYIIFKSENIYISSEVQKTKYKGDLYNYVNNEVGKLYYHYGDNIISDYKIPKNKGIKSKHYSELEHNGINSLISSSKRGFPYFSGGVARALLLKYQLDEFSEITTEYIGYIIPFIYAYVLWIINCAREKKIDKIFFLSRDGYLPYIIAKNMDIKDIQMEYLYMSRKVFNDPINLKKYFLEKGFFNNKIIGIVDIGWHGSLQNNIKLLLPDNIKIHGFYIGMMGDSRLNKDEYSAFLYDETTNNKEFIFILKYIAVVEYIFLAPHGSVEKISYINNELNIIMEKSNYFNHVLVDKIEKLSIEYTNKMTIIQEAAGCNFLLDAGSLKIFAYNLNKFLTNPSKKFVQKISSVTLSDNKLNITMPLITLKFIGIFRMFNNSWWVNGNRSLRFYTRILNIIEIKIYQIRRCNKWL